MIHDYVPAALPMAGLMLAAVLATLIQMLVPTAAWVRHGLIGLSCVAVAVGVYIGQPWAEDYLLDLIDAKIEDPGHDIEKFVFDYDPSMQAAAELKPALWREARSMVQHIPQRYGGMTVSAKAEIIFGLTPLKNLIVWTAARAEDDKLIRFIEASLATMRTFQRESPARCAAIAVGGEIDYLDLTPEDLAMLRAEHAALAAALRGALVNPVKLPNDEQLLQAQDQFARTAALTPVERKQLMTGSRAPPEPACSAELKVLTAVLALPAANAGYMIRAMMARQTGHHPTAS